MNVVLIYMMLWIAHCRWHRGGGHWPRKGVWGCAALKTPFSSLSCRSQGSYFKQKSLFTRPHFEKSWKFSPLQPQFLPKFKLTSPQSWKFSAHKPTNLEIFSSQAPKFGNFPLTSPLFQRQMSVRKAPHFGNPGRTPLPEKKLSAPPRRWHQKKA